MPELPEVQTVVDDLQRVLPGARFSRVEVFHDKTLEGTTARHFSRKLKGRQIRRVFRRAKHIVLDLEGDYWIAIHLRMTGRLTVHRRVLSPPPKHLRVLFHFEDDRTLSFVDTRKFGRIYLCRYRDVVRHPRLGKLGQEPLDPDFSAEKFLALLKPSRGMIKPYLLNQSRLVGIGNIYADEILWQARIHPKTRIERLRSPERLLLYEAIRAVLEEAVGLRGSSIRDYRDASGEKGGYQDRFRVYDRAGEPCLRCETAIRKMRVGQRGTYYCPKEQRLRK
ncbi:MAG: bifunctional DNA-formamidopyrimidine glycosylase/DNA-(apurinic or apyrimidinic site) lyase [Acidobacteriota bacterium]